MSLRHVSTHQGCHQAGCQGVGVMNSIANLSRRRVLGGAALSGLLLGFHTMGHHPITGARAATPRVVLSPNVYVTIDFSGKVSVIVPRSEMGTGIKTSLAQALAD